MHRSVKPFKKTGCSESLCFIEGEQEQLGKMLTELKAQIARAKVIFFW